MTGKALEIQDLPINATAKLTNDQRKPFVEMIHEQFSNKRSLFHSANKLREREILEGYRKKVGFQRLRNELNKTRAKIDDLESEMEDLGLTTEGSRLQSYSTDSKNYKQRIAVQKLDDLFDALEKNAPDVQLENKLVARMLLSTTHGEAVVILRSVLGNELIPGVTKEQLVIEQK